MTTSYLGYDFNRAVVQKAGGAVAAASATDTITKSAHGLAVNDAIVITAVGGASGVAVGTRYYVVTVPSSSTFKISATIGGSAISLGTATPSYNPIVEVAFGFPNQAGVNKTDNTYEWAGGGQFVTLTKLKTLSLQLALEAQNASAHASIFSKTAPGGDLPGGIDGSTATGIGGGNDIAGVTVGIRLEGTAIKDVDGTRSTVSYARWFPQGVLALSDPGQVQDGNKWGQMQYNFAALRSTTDIAGGAIANVSSGGEFFYDGEL